MISFLRRGTRVKIKPGVRTFYRAFRGDERGKIICELENNLGQSLVEVEWDGIGQSPVFSTEIELDTEMIKEES